MVGKKFRVLISSLSVTMLMICLPQFAWAAGTSGENDIYWSAAEITAGEISDISALGEGWALSDGADYGIRVEDERVNLTAHTGDERGVLSYNFEPKAGGKYKASTRLYMTNDLNCFNVYDADGNVVAGFRTINFSGHRLNINVGGVVKEIYTARSNGWYDVSVIIDIDNNNVEFEIKNESGTYDATRVLNGYFCLSEDLSVIKTKFPMPVNDDITSIAAVGFSQWNPANVTTDFSLGFDRVSVQEYIPEEAAYTTESSAWDKNAQALGLDNTYALISSGAGVVKRNGYEFEMSRVGSGAKDSYVGIKKGLTVNSDNKLQIKTAFYSGNGTLTDFGYGTRIQLKYGTRNVCYVQISKDNVIAFASQGVSLFNLLAPSVTSNYVLEADTWYDVVFDIDKTSGTVKFSLLWDIPAGAEDNYLSNYSVGSQSTYNNISISKTENGRAMVSAEFSNTNAKNMDAIEMTSYIDGASIGKSKAKVKMVSTNYVNVNSDFKFSSRWEFGGTGANNTDGTFKITNGDIYNPMSVNILLATYNNAENRLIQAAVKKYDDIVGETTLGYGYKLDTSNLVTGDYEKAFIFKDELKNLIPMVPPATRTK